MAVELIQRLISVGDYHKMIAAGILLPGDKVELLNGQIIEMSPIGSKHAACAEKMVDVLKDLLKEQAMVRVQNPITLLPNSEPEPDISVVKIKADYYAESHPRSEDTFIVIEVADSSIDVDQQVKTSLYATAQIPEYWIANLEEDRLEVYSEPLDGVYKERKIFFKEDLLQLHQFEKEILVSKLLL